MLTWWFRYVNLPPSLRSTSSSILSSSVPITSSPSSLGEYKGEDGGSSLHTRMLLSNSVESVDDIREVLGLGCKNSGLGKVCEVDAGLR